MIMYNVKDFLEQTSGMKAKVMQEIENTGVEEIEFLKIELSILENLEYVLQKHKKFNNVINVGEECAYSKDGMSYEEALFKCSLNK